MPLMIAALIPKPMTIPAAAISCICCTAKPSENWVRFMNSSFILYAEHEFNASTFAARVIAGTGTDFYSSVTGRGDAALRRTKTAVANEVSLEIQKRYSSPDEARADILARLTPVKS